MQLPAFIDFGAPDKNRTRNPQIRSLMLYPIELRAQRKKLYLEITQTVKFKFTEDKVKNPNKDDGKNDFQESDAKPNLELAATGGTHGRIRSELTDESTGSHTGSGRYALGLEDHRG